MILRDLCHMWVNRTTLRGQYGRVGPKDLFQSYIAQLLNYIITLGPGINTNGLLLSDFEKYANTFCYQAGKIVFL